MAGEPVTRPPISSVRRRRFSCIGEGPRMRGRIFAATSAQEEEASAVQAAVEDEVWVRWSGSFSVVELGFRTWAWRLDPIARMQEIINQAVRRSMVSLFCGYPRQI